MNSNKTFSLTKEQKEILDKYNIDYNVTTKKELLINIDMEITAQTDKDFKPTEDSRILERLYDEIYSNEK